MFAGRDLHLRDMSRQPVICGLAALMLGVHVWSCPADAFELAYIGSEIS